MRINFKKDINNVFFKEFAQRINFSGVRINAVITENKSKGLLAGRMGREHDDYLTEFDIKVSYKTRDLPRKVEVGDIVEVNEIEYVVKSCWERYGVTNIFLSRVEG